MSRSVGTVTFGPVATPRIQLLEQFCRTTNGTVPNANGGFQQIRGIRDFYRADYISPMCNLYAITRSQDAIRQFTKALRDSVGNLPSLPAIFPDQMAPVVRTADDGKRELTTMRWGFPPPPKVGTRPVTNVRNTKSAFWRAWLKPEFRCVVPASSFCEYTDKQPKVPHWFAIDESRPLFFFAGIWRRWTGTRGTKANPVEGEHLLYSFLTCEPNNVVKPIHSKAMPVMLTTKDEVDQWLTAETSKALELQRPLPEKQLTIVAKGERRDEAA